MAGKAKPIDWAAVEADYRAGLLTDRAIGQKFGLSHGAIQQRAKKDGWSRDLTERIKKRRETKLAKSILAKNTSQMTLATENQVVEANAEMQSGVILGQRKDIRALRVIVSDMASELAAIGSHDLQDALEVVLQDKVDAIGSKKAQAALYKAFDSAIALGGRSSTVRNLVAALSTLVDKERQAFGIDKDSGGKSLGEFLDALV